MGSFQDGEWKERRNREKTDREKVENRLFLWCPLKASLFHILYVSLLSFQREPLFATSFSAPLDSLYSYSSVFLFPVRLLLLLNGFCVFY